ncbi:MAG: GNAT family N-acetyltransferase [Alphaproteobacteria bacterium]|nr:GNAT family N-acetyltransferase [Alphaproteobacteria bacterium]
MTVLRHATANDAALIAAIHTESWQDAYAGMLPARFLADEYPARCLAFWCDKLTTPEPGAVLLDPEGRGFIAAWLRDDAVYIDALHVRPGARGAGLGARLLGDAVAVLGARRVWLEALAANNGALRFYARHGARLSAPYPATLQGLPVSERRAEWDDPAPLLRLGMRIPGPGLSLRPLETADKPAIFAMNGDPRVMRHFPVLMTRAESDAWVDRLMAHHAAQGFGFCALDLPDARCIGVVGLMRIPWSAPFTPAVEIGWRIRPEFEGRGLVTRSAGLVLRHAFEVLRLREVVSFTIPANTRSRAVMERIGMRPAGTFGHPRLAPGHPMHQHLLYRSVAP